MEINSQHAPGFIFTLDSAPGVYRIPRCVLSCNLNASEYSMTQPVVGVASIIGYKEAHTDICADANGIMASLSNNLWLTDILALMAIKTDWRSDACVAIINAMSTQNYVSKPVLTSVLGYLHDVPDSTHYGAQVNWSAIYAFGIVIAAYLGQDLTALVTIAANQKLYKLVDNSFIVKAVEVACPNLMCGGRNVIAYCLQLLNPLFLYEVDALLNHISVSASVTVLDVWQTLGTVSSVGSGSFAGSGRTDIITNVGIASFTAPGTMDGSNTASFGSYTPGAALINYPFPPTSWTSPLLGQFNAPQEPNAGTYLEVNESTEYLQVGDIPNSIYRDFVLPVSNFSADLWRVGFTTDIIESRGVPEVNVYDGSGELIDKIM